MAVLTVTFHGLCFFAARSANDGDIICHPEFGDHTPTLTVRAKDVKLKESKWQPAFVGHDSAGEEIGVWDLRGEAIALGKLAAPLTFVAGQKAVDFKGLHPNAQALPKAKVDKIVFPVAKPHGAIVTLRAGTLKYLGSPQINIKIRHKGTTTPNAEKHSSALQWVGEIVQATQPVNKAGEVLALVVDRDIAIHVTNVSRDVFPDGLEHWEHYYKLVTGVEIEERAELKTPSLDTDVYDCVPPANLML
jgi:hypothetical protein